MDSSERVILTFLNDEKARTPHELSIGCRMAEPAVRYHLRRLTALRLIEKVTDPGPAIKPGRKPGRYRILSPARQQSAAMLCRVMLNHLPTVLPEGDDIPRRLADWFLAEPENAPSNAIHSVPQLVDWLNSHHYAAGWEAGPRGPVLMISNCPFRDVDTPDGLLCAMDANILSMLYGKSWKKTAPAGASNRGTCRFVPDL